jgi:hypothetical protein
MDVAKGKLTLMETTEEQRLERRNHRRWRSYPGVAKEGIGGLISSRRRRLC